jgi:Ca-activated chloride channel family protein
VTFLRPDLAAWALTVPVIVACWLVHRALRVGFSRRMSVAARFAALSRRSGGTRDRTVLVAGVLAAASLSLALMRPQAPITRKVPDYERQDLIIMLDRSASMRARDIRPSRFARATRELRTVIRRKPAGIDRFALIGFAEAAVMLSYPTTDADSLLFYLDWIDADPTLLFGTNIGAALDRAIALALKEDRQARPVFLIVSDGEDFGEQLDQALVAARTRGFRVNCIGIGGTGLAPILVPEPGGRETVLRDDTGRAVTTRFTEGTLRRIATTTGGRYVRSATGEELAPAIAAIVDGERRQVGWRTSTERRDLYPVFLALAALAGSAVWVLS